jgi:hypothetical protein
MEGIPPLRRWSILPTCGRPVVSAGNGLARVAPLLDVIRNSFEGDPRHGSLVALSAGDPPAKRYLSVLSRVIPRVIPLTSRRPPVGSSIVIFSKRRGSVP